MPVPSPVTAPICVGPDATIGKTASVVTHPVTVIGGGLAGLAAGCALAGAGYPVRLLERRPYVGGRASSYPHPGVDEVIDNCQHILLGCCTNLIALYRRLGVPDEIAWFDRFTYIEPGGRQSVVAPTALPAPMHTAVSFLRARAFSLADKLAIARGLLPLMRRPPSNSEESEETFAAWCVRHRQTAGAIRRFWEPILASALNDDLDRVSVRYAAKVIRDSFLSSPTAGSMGIPRLPLSELYSRAAAYIEQHGGKVHLRASVDAITPDGDGGWCVRAGEESFTSQAVVLGLSFEATRKLLPALPVNPAAAALGEQLSQMEHAPITSIHLWFDREITPLLHAVLLDATIQWMYQVSKLQPARHSGPGPGSYLELVVSASRSLIPMPRQAIVDLAMRELALFFPAVKSAILLKAAVVKEVRATFAVPPGVDRLRPSAQSPWPGIYLAGDWTATGWPATMESAVRSGHLAAEAFTRDRARPLRFVAPDLPPTGLMRLFG